MQYSSQFLEVSSTAAIFSLRNFNPFYLEFLYTHRVTMSDSDSDSEVHGSSNGESDFEGFSAADVRKAAAASARGAARPSTSTAVPMDTDDSSESEWDSDESPSDKSDTSTDEVRLYFIWTICSCLSRMKFPLLLSPYPRSAGGPIGRTA